MLSQSIKGPFTGDIDSISMLYDVMKFVPYNYRTLTTLRCVSKPFRSGVQSPKSPWSSHEDILISRYGHHILFNAKEDEEGRSCFSLYSVSPMGRKFRTICMESLSRNHILVANGLSCLCLHHSQIDNDFFIHLKSLSNLKELELVSCRGITSIEGASVATSLERLEVVLCPLKADGVKDLALPKLKKLQLRACSRLNNMNEIAAETASSLEELYIESCDVYDDTVSTLFGLLSSKLRILHLSNTHIDTALSLIPEKVREEGLTSLHLSETPLRFETLQDVAPSLQKNLEFLSVENCADLESFEAIGRMHGLRFLDVSGAYHGEGLQFLTSCTELELFRMGNSQIDSIMFLSSLTHLRVFDAGFSALTDCSLMFLENSPVLDTVVLTGCILITNINMLRTCPNIKRAFCSRTAVTNEGILSLCECDSLEELDLKMTSVTDVNVLAKCKSLKMLNICGNVASTEGIQDVIAKSGLEVIRDTLEGDCDPEQ